MQNGSCFIYGGAMLAAAAALTAPTFGQACTPHQGNQGTNCCQPGGPDVIVGDIIDITNYSGTASVDAFCIGTTSCNIGDQNLLWIASNNQHPVIGQTLYKLKNGVLEQIGQSWLKHGFTALTQNACGCGCSGQGGSVLGIGCSDPYCCGLNGQQSNLGPKWQVNAFTGIYNYPPANPTWSGTIARRLQVKVTDLEPSTASVIYFGECQYVTADDAASGNQDNNASHRQVTVTGTGSSWSFALAGTTRRELPAIRAWKLAHPDVYETDVKVPDEGTMVLAARVIDLGAGRHRYEYALQNVTSHRSGQSFSVPLASGVEIEAGSMGFHDVDYHSGDGGGNVSQDGTNWAQTVAGGTASWATDPYTPGNEFNANALRWGTMYNFRFICNSPAEEGFATMGLFRPRADGLYPSILLRTLVPQAVKTPCPWDCADDNGTVEITDLLGLLAEWDNDGNCDFNGDNVVDISDLLELLANYGLVCP
jgi:hypothetical protein